MSSAKKDPVRYPCQNCGLVSKGCSRCSGCLKARYCGAVCQKQHWKTHKQLCQDLRTSEDDIEDPTPSQVLLPPPKKKKEQAQECRKCHNDSVQEGSPFMCFTCGVFIVCGSCITTTEMGGRNGRPTAIEYACSGCCGESEEPPCDLLQNLLDENPTGPHVRYARLILAQMKLNDAPQFTGTEQDTEAAKKEYLWLANHLDYAPAQMAMGSFHHPNCHPVGECWDGPLPMYLLENNKGIETAPFSSNKKLAIAYYDRSVAQEWSLALTTVGTMYRNGKELFPQDLEKAASLLTKAADLGDPLAAHNLSHMYLHGIGVEKDMVQALAHMSQAANHGLFQSMLMFGQLGMQMDFLRDEARTWMLKLVEANWEPLNEQIASVYGTLRRSYGV